MRRWCTASTTCGETARSSSSATTGSTLPWRRAILSTSIPSATGRSPWLDRLGVRWVVSGPRGGAAAGSFGLASGLCRRRRPGLGAARRHAPGSADRRRPRWPGEGGAPDAGSLADHLAGPGPRPPGGGRDLGPGLAGLPEWQASAGGSLTWDPDGGPGGAGSGPPPVALPSRRIRRGRRTVLAGLGGCDAGSPHRPTFKTMPPFRTLTSKPSPGRRGPDGSVWIRRIGPISAFRSSSPAAPATAFPATSISVRPWQRSATPPARRAAAGLWFARPPEPLDITFDGRAPFHGVDRRGPVAMDGPGSRRRRAACRSSDPAGGVGHHHGFPRLGDDPERRGGRGARRGRHPRAAAPPLARLPRGPLPLGRPRGYPGVRRLHGGAAGTSTATPIWWPGRRCGSPPEERSATGRNGRTYSSSWWTLCAPTISPPTATSATPRPTWPACWRSPGPWWRRPTRRRRGPSPRWCRS